jgi:undecaprenyl diphosphate synthase
LLIESSTKNNSKLTLNLCFNYGGQQDILNAAIKFKKVKHGNFEKFLLTENLPPVDLLIRTSGEQRISNFFL